MINSNFKFPRENSIGWQLSVMEYMDLQGSISGQTETYVWNLIWGNTRTLLRGNGWANPLGGLL